MREYSIKVSSDFDNKSVEKLLKLKLNLSDNVIKKIKYNCVYLNGKAVTNINDNVSCGDELKILLPIDVVNPFAKKCDIPLEIIYEDEYFIAVVKNKGMLTHSSKGNSAPTLEGALVNYFDFPFTFRAINRLDRDTSGIIIVAKDMISASLLNEQMKRGEIKKTYFAILDGVPKKSSFIIDAPIDREKVGSMKRIVSPLGKKAVTECLSITPISNGLSVAKILLHTGRTHQIRVHFAYIGYPLYADSLYGNKIENKTYTLHAGQIELTHPFTKEKLQLKSEIKI